VILPAEARSIASIISGKLKVKVESGDNWKYSHNKKTVYYRTQDLAVVDEQDVIANLLHECGHAKYTDNPSKMDYSFIRKDCANPEEAKHVIKNFFFLLNEVEDFRIEDRVRQSYPFAEEYLPEYSFKTLWEMNNISKRFANNPKKKPPKYIQYLLANYVALGNYKSQLSEDVDEDVAKVVTQTIDLNRKARLEKSTTSLLKVLEEVYPYIKKWIKEMEPEKTESLEGCYATEYSHEDRKITYEELYSDVKTLINPLASILCKALTDNLFNRLAGRHRTGRGIDNRVLYKARLGLDRIFTRIEEAKAKDYQISLLVDESGSMNGCEKNLNAARAAVLFANALDKIDIPYSLFGFNSGIRQYKKSTERLSGKHHVGFESCYNNSYSSRVFLPNGEYDDENNAGYNSDGYAVEQVKLSMRGVVGKKILIVLTDGQPEDYRSHQKDLKESLKEAEKENIKIFGIGIGDDVHAKDYYANSLQVLKIDELPLALSKILIKALKK